MSEAKKLFICDPRLTNTDFEVGNSGLVTLPQFDDAPDGNLVIAESGKGELIEFRRVYWTNQLANPQAIRGKHAHKQFVQAIFCLNGSFRLDLDDGKTSQKVDMSISNRGVLLGPMLWHTMTEFSPECIILTLARDYYDKRDYLRWYPEFWLRAQMHHTGLSPLQRLATADWGKLEDWRTKYISKK